MSLVGKSFLFFFPVFLSLSFLSCKAKYSEFSEPTFIYDGYPLNVKREENALVFTSVPYKNALELAFDFDPLIKFLSGRIQQKVIFAPLDQYYKLYLLLELGKIDIAVVDPHVFKKRNLEDNYRVLLRLHFKELQKNKSTLVARNDSEIKTMTEVREKQNQLRISFDNPDSTFGYIVPLSVFRKFDIQTEKFKEIAFSSNFENTVQGILSGNFDLGWIDLLTYEKFKSTAIGLKIIYESENLDHYIIVVNKNIKEETQRKIIQALMELEGEKHKNILGPIHPKLTAFKRTAEEES